MEREDTEAEQQWNREQTIPERIWVCKRWYQRYDGMEYVESVCDDESLLQGYRDHGYTITEYTRVKPCE